MTNFERNHKKQSKPAFHHRAHVRWTIRDPGPGGGCNARLHGHRPDH